MRPPSNEAGELVRRRDTPGASRRCGFASSGTPQDDDPVRPLQLYALNVVAPHYGTGVGQRLLEASIGQEPAYLWVAEGTWRARRFYEKNGFRLDDGSQYAERLGIRELRMVR